MFKRILLRAKGALLRAKEGLSRAKEGLLRAKEVVFRDERDDLTVRSCLLRAKGCRSGAKAFLEVSNVCREAVQAPRFRRKTSHLPSKVCGEPSIVAALADRKGLFRDPIVPWVAQRVRDVETEESFLA
jgi:hypothetical protein